MFLTLGHRATGSNEKEKKEIAKRKAERAAKRAAIVYKLEKRERERIDKELQKSVTFGNWVRKDIQYSQFQNYELTYAHFVRFPTPFS